MSNFQIDKWNGVSPTLPLWFSHYKNPQNNGTSFGCNKKFKITLMKGIQKSNLMVNKILQFTTKSSQMKWCQSSLNDCCNVTCVKFNKKSCQWGGVNPFLFLGFLLWENHHFKAGMTPFHLAICKFDIFVLHFDV